MIRLLSCTLAHAVLLVLVPVADAQCPIRTITPLDGADGDLFGRAAALDGDRLLVGAPEHDQMGADAGAAYVYERTPDGEWVQVARLLASDGSSGDEFGGFVALSGELAVVGAEADEPAGSYSGSAYVFERTPGGTWVETAKLVPSDSAPYQLFGVVAIGGPNEILVGAPQATLGAIAPGAVYLFRRTPSGWSETSRLTETIPMNGIRFGARVDVSGARVAIGASPAGAPTYSRTVVFDRSGQSWTESAVIQIPGEGTVADLEGTRMVVGSPWYSSPYQLTGRVRIFDLIGGSWVETALIEPEVPNHIGLVFGLRVALSGERIVLSSKLNGGTVYQFEKRPSGWIEVGRIGGPPSFLAWDELRLDRERMLVAGQQDGPGSVTEYVVAPTEIVYCLSFPNSTGAAARISASDCNVVAENDFSLHASPVPDKPGLFYYGTHAVQVPFGGGARCVAGMTFRLPLQTAQAGTLSQDVDLTAPPFPAGQITAGSTWLFQAWFRDGPGAFNLSDAIAVRFF